MKKFIKGYEGLYTISDEGVVTNERTGRVIKANPVGGGYLALSLWKNGVRDRRKIHRLVAEAFIPNPKQLNVVHHVNENKTDNRVDNLKWVTSLENNTANDRSIKIGDKNSQSVHLWNDAGDELYFKSGREAIRNGYYVHLVLAGQQSTTRGYYVERI